MKALCITATASNQGKTMLTTALLYHYQESVRPFKIGPDFIDPQFHEFICGTPSVNLDTFMMNKEQVQWIFQKYNNKNMAILEGVMGFYDGMDKGSSAYDVAKLLNVPTVLLLDGSSSYITVSAVLHGLVHYRNDNTLKGVILNKLSSIGHYELIKKQIESDFKDIVVLGWIEKDLPSLKETHLGLELSERSKIAKISKEVLTHIDLDLLDKVSTTNKIPQIVNYPFHNIKKIPKKLAIVKDENFSFHYHDNIEFLKEIFQEVVRINASKDEPIDSSIDSIFIAGGYVETNKAYATLKKAHNFKASLIEQAKTKTIYAECAGLLYLGNSVDEKEMSGILDLNFTLHTRFQRMGYYHVGKQKGHSFHYTNILGQPKGLEVLSKTKQGQGQIGSWEKEKVFGTYLHSMFRGNLEVLRRLADVKFTEL